MRVRRYDPDKEYDDLPKRVSGSRSKYIRAGETKYFSDLLGPLRRFLRKNVGRPWNKVYSEMKESLDDRKVTGRHVFEHVSWEVETHAFVDIDGELYTWATEGESPFTDFTSIQEPACSAGAITTHGGERTANRKAPWKELLTSG